MPIDVEIQGLIETQRKLEQVAAEVHGTPIVNAMKDATLLVQRGAKINAPVDTGRLRASITPEIRTMGNEVQGVVGSNVAYAPFMELGTRPHWPPIAALEVWAQRHGTTAFLVARAIARKGTKAREFLKKAFEDAKDRIYARFEKAVQEVVNK